VRTLIAWAGDDPEREGLLETPKRVTKAFGEFFAGYEDDAEKVLSKTFKEVGGYDDIVFVKDIPFSSHCEHHMVPFIGKVHIAYLPHDGVVGLSKLARLVEVYARRLQVQENMTAQIIDAINENLNPRGAAVMVEAEHMCMSMRGVRAHGSSTITQRFTGVFAEDRHEQDRFFALCIKR
jgi:GTP cyclohydrolase I